MDRDSRKIIRMQECKSEETLRKLYRLTVGGLKAVKLLKI